MPNDHYFTTISSFIGTDQQPMRSALLIANLRGCEGGRCRPARQILFPKTLANPSDLGGRESNDFL